MRDKNPNALGSVSSILNDAIQAITFENCSNRGSSNQLMKYVGLGVKIIFITYLIIWLETSNPPEKSESKMQTAPGFKNCPLFIKPCQINFLGCVKKFLNWSRLMRESGLLNSISFSDNSMMRPHFTLL